MDQIRLAQYQPPNYSALTINELCRRVDDQISAEIDWFLEVGCRKTVVNNKQNIVLLGNFGDVFHINDVQSRIGW